MPTPISVTAAADDDVDNIASIDTSLLATFHHITSSYMYNIITSARCLRENESSRYCSDVRPSVRLSGTSVHCDHTVHFSADLSLRLDSPVFWLP